MRFKSILQKTLLSLALLMIPAVSFAANNRDVDISEELKKSLVYLDISGYAYDLMRPWKSPEVGEKFGYGCAISGDEVLTTAWNLTDTALVRARKYGQNEFIGATVKVIDYETNLCILKLDSSAMDKPLKPIRFSEEYVKGTQLKSYWLSSGGHLTSARGYLDRAEVTQSTVSYTRLLNYIAANTSSDIGRGRLYCMGKKPIGIAFWADGDSQESGLIPAEAINAFLADSKDGDYTGFGTAGFATSTLLDPARREWLKMPEDLKHGIFVNKVFKLGTGSDILKSNDVILAIDGKSLNPYGRYLHKKFDRISFHHLINRHKAGEEITFDLWRSGAKKRLTTKAARFDVSEMLVPYYQYGRRAGYIVTGGFVIQALSRDYLRMWGDGWPGKVPPHLYNYYRNSAFEPSDDRGEIVILSYCLPAPINLGYQRLRLKIISKFNGMKITRLSDIPKAMELNPDSKYHVIEFEHANPTVVIPRENLEYIDAMIAKNYGITELSNIDQ